MLKTTALLLGIALWGCGSGGSGFPTNISGTVTWGLTSTPALGVTVLVTDAHGAQTTVTTDATGAFSVSGVATPYSAAAVLEAPTTPTGAESATVYLGLTRANPALVLDNPTTPTQTYHGTLSVTLSGGTYPQPAANYTTNFLFVSPQAYQSISTPGVLSATSSFEVDWSGPASTTSGTLFVLQVEADGAGLPTAYPGYGTTSVSVTDGVSTNASVALASVAAGVVTGLAIPGPGYSLQEVDAFLVFPNDYYIQIVADTTSSSSFSYTTPSIAGTTLDMDAFAAGPAGVWFPQQSGLAANVSGLTFNCRGAPTLLTPSDQQTNVTSSTPLSWSGDPGAIYQVVLNGNLSIWTAETSVTLPHLTGVGFGPFPTTSYTWSVSAYNYNGLSSVDAWTNPNSPPPSGPACIAGTPDQSFTTSATP